MKLNGFSLIEILVSMSLVAVVMAAANQVLFSFLKSEQKARSTMEVKQVGDNALAVMVNEIRNAEEITACPTGGITFDSKNGSTHTFQCSGEQIIWNGSSLTGSDLTLVDGTCNIDCFIGKYGTISISFDLEKESIDPVRKASPVSFNTTVLLRNW
jgi:prepilin-type N-terminal cleavage/methylation domain-containing protein